MTEISRNVQNANYAPDIVSVKDFGAVGDVMMSIEIGEIRYSDIST